MRESLFSAGRGQLFHWTVSGGQWSPVFHRSFIQEECVFFHIRCVTNRVNRCKLAYRPVQRHKGRLSLACWQALPWVIVRLREYCKRMLARIACVVEVTAFTWWRLHLIPVCKTYNFAVWMTVNEAFTYFCLIKWYWGTLPMWFELGTVNVINYPTHYSSTILLQMSRFCYNTLSP